MVRSVALCLGLLPVAAMAEPLAARPGAWEITVTTTMSGNVLPPDALAKLTPERRAMVEKMMADHGDRPSTSTRKTCVKKEDLEQDRFLRDRDTKCTIRATTRTATRLVATRTCAGPPPSEGTVEFEAKTRESVTGSIDQKRGDTGRLHIDIQGRWLEASCAGIEPLQRKSR